MGRTIYSFLQKRFFFAILILLLGASAYGDDPRARLLSVSGTVEYRPAAVETWSRARILQDLFLQDSLRTAVRSRAAVLFFDETQVRLGPNAHLTVEDRDESEGSVFHLLDGEGWFRTKRGDADLQVRTPAATAAVRGTEFGVRIDDDGATTVTVLEGAVDLFNDAGTVRLAAGEEGFARPGEAPTKRVVLNPEESVQWIIYYPFVPSYNDYPPGPAIDALRAGEPERALALAGAPAASADGADGALAVIRMLAYLELGDYDGALAVVPEEGGGPTAEEGPTADVLAHAGLVRLVIGDPAAALRFFDRALVADPANLFALSYRAFLELYRNDQTAAAAFATRALEAHPDGVLANVVAGEIAQAGFDLERADRLFAVALRTDPGNPRALLNRGRIAFGSDRPDDARRYADQAAAAHPDLAGVESLRGYLAFAEGDRAAAIAHFQRALELEPELAEAYLGLGLAHFQAGDGEQGLFDMLAATLLEPRISLYQSYLAKAYYELRRPEEAFAVIATAKTLDDRDPTPWLYESAFLRGEYRWADSLVALNAAVARNDNRGVYRSRALLDRDEATANASQAAVYTYFGFTDWGKRVALASLRRDFSNAASHLLLSGLYLAEPDRLVAGRSELLQYYLLAPVNLNTFANFNEYTVLFDRRDVTFQPGIMAGYPLVVDAEYFSAGGSDRFTHSALLAYQNAEGARTDASDQLVQLDLTGKLALSRRSDLFARLGFFYKNAGADDYVSVGFDLGDDRQVSLEQATESPSTTEQSQQLNMRGEIGGRYAFGPLSPLISFLGVESIVILQEDPEAPIDVDGYLLDSSTGLSNTTVVWSAQQNLSPADNHNLSVGASFWFESTYLTYDTEAYLATDPTQRESVLDDDDSTQSYGGSAYGYYAFPIRDSLLLTAGARAQYNETEVVDQEGELRIEEFPAIDPSLGIALEVGPRTTIRGALFKRLQSSSLSFDISPSTLDGFFYEQDQIARFTDRWEYAVAVDYELDRAFVTNSVIVRRYDFPPEIFYSQFDNADEYRLESTINWLAFPRLGITLDNEARLFDTDLIRIIDDKADLVTVFSFPAGITLKITNRYLFQSFLDDPHPDLGTTHTYILNAGMEARPADRWTVTLTATNILDRPVEYYFLPDVSGPKSYVGLFGVQLMVEYTW